MTTDRVSVDLTTAEARVLLAFLRNPARLPADRPEWTDHYLGPTLTAVRQRVEAALLVKAADEGRLVEELFPVAAETESELRAGWGDR